MKIKNLIDDKYKFWTKDFNQEVSGLYAGDYLSNVLRNGERKNALITVITNMNALAVAVMLEMPLIVFTEGNVPTKDMIDKANEEKVTLVSTNQKSYECIIDFKEKGLI